MSLGFLVRLIRIEPPLVSKCGQTQPGDLLEQELSELAVGRRRQPFNRPKRDGNPEDEAVELAPVDGSRLPGVRTPNPDIRAVRADAVDLDRETAVLAHLIAVQ